MASTKSVRTPKLFATPFPIRTCSERSSSFGSFNPFTSALNALKQCNAIAEGILTDELRTFLETNLPKVKEGKKPKFTLGVTDPKIGSQINEVTKIPCQSDECVCELIRGVRLHFDRFVCDFKVSEKLQNEANSNCMKNAK